MFQKKTRFLNFLFVNVVQKCTLPKNATNVIIVNYDEKKLMKFENLPVKIHSNSRTTKFPNFVLHSHTKFSHRMGVAA